MKVLWFTNIMLPRVAGELGKTAYEVGGWLVGLSDSLLQSGEVELTVASPALGERALISGKVDTLSYFGFPWKVLRADKYDPKAEAYAETIIMQTTPDIVHVFGTEFPHTLAVVNTCEKLGIIDKVVVNIQGLTSVYYKHYYAGLPHSVTNSYTFKDLVLRRNIRQQRKSFLRRGKYEIEALQKVQHVAGRTDWDKACTSQVNPYVQYHLCNETLRGEFYRHNWDIEKCERFSIFLSQAGTPIKGLHFVIEALPEIIKRYPDTHLYIAGKDIIKTDSLRAKAEIGSYGVYIRRLIERYNLREKVTFTGKLNEKSMCERFLKSHVFVSPSAIENSPNSVGEAMLLGVPVISSDVGGVKNLLAHNEDGIIYQHDAPYMLAHYVCKLFADDETALKFSGNAKRRAAVTHSREKNLRDVLRIYNEIG